MYSCLPEPIWTPKSGCPTRTVTGRQKLAVHASTISDSAHLIVEPEPHGMANGISKGRVVLVLGNLATVGS
jgi:hypothetical protein